MIECAITIIIIPTIIVIIMENNIMAEYVLTAYMIATAVAIVLILIMLVVILITDFVDIGLPRLKRKMKKKYNKSGNIAN